MEKVAIILILIYLLMSSIFVVIGNVLEKKVDTKFKLKYIFIWSFISIYFTYLIFKAMTFEKLGDFFSSGFLLIPLTLSILLYVYFLNKEKKENLSIANNENKSQNARDERK